MSFYYSPYFGGNSNYSRIIPVSYHPRQPQYHYGYDDEEEEEDNSFAQPFYPKAYYEREAAYRNLQQEQLRRYQEQQRFLAERERQRLEEQQRIFSERERQRRIWAEQEKLRRQQVLEEQRRLAEEKKAAQEALLLRRKAAFLRFTHAAKVLQRAYRIHLAKKNAVRAKELEVKTQAAKVIQAAFRQHLAVKQEESAFIIQRTLRAFKSQQEAKRVVKKLRSLAEIKSQVESFRQQYEEKVLSKPVYEASKANATLLLPNKDYLIYEEALLKAQIKLDGVLSEGFEVVRDTRKAVIAHIQKLLGLLDAHKNRAMEVESEVAVLEPEDQVNETETESETEWIEVAKEDENQMVEN